MVERSLTNPPEKSTLGCAVCGHRASASATSTASTSALSPSLNVNININLSCSAAAATAATTAISASFGTEPLRADLPLRQTVHGTDCEERVGEQRSSFPTMRTARRLRILRMG